jgi:hypothetical protein
VIKDEFSRDIFLSAAPTGLASYAYRVLQNYQIVPTINAIANDMTHAFCAAGIFGLINSRINSPYVSAAVTFAAGTAWELVQLLYTNPDELGRDLGWNTVGITAAMLLTKRFVKAAPALESIVDPE